MEVLFFLVVTSAVFVAGQRPFYAGSQPIGVYVPVNATTTTESIGDRVGEGDVTTQRLPIEANGDRDLIDRLSKLPIDNQPFWFINWQALESHRNNTQTYPQRPNTFINPITPTPNSEFETDKSNSGLPNSNSELGTTDSATLNSISTVPNYIMTTNANSVNPNSFITTTTEIRSTKFENNDSDIGITNSISNSDPEFNTEDPIEASSNSLPTSEVISS